MQALTVLPMSQEIKLKAGETYRGYVTVANPEAAEEDLRYTVEAGPYSVLDEGYTADLATESQRSMIVQWTTVEEPEGVLSPGQSQRVYFEVAVPEGAPAGGQYAAISISARNEGEGGVQDSLAMASVVFAEVEGETVREGRIVENKVVGFVTEPRVISEVALENSGNVHETATTVVAVREVLTGKVVYPQEGETGAYTEAIMPESTRMQVRYVDGLAGLGVYEVEQAVTYMGEVSEVKQTVVVCPIWFMVLVAVTVAAITGAVVRMVWRSGLKHREERADEDVEN